jgi:hypothetical protein
MAGEKQNLPSFAFLPEKIERRCKTRVVKTYERVVKYDGTGIVRRESQLAYGETQCQIKLVHGAARQRKRAPAGRVPDASAEALKFLSNIVCCICRA